MANEHPKLVISWLPDLCNITNELKKAFDDLALNYDAKLSAVENFSDSVIKYIDDAMGIIKLEEIVFRDIRQFDLKTRKDGFMVLVHLKATIGIIKLFKIAISGTNITENELSELREALLPLATFFVDYEKIGMLTE